MEKRKFHLRPGVVINFRQKGKQFADSNLTDEIAKDYLKQNPKGMRFFSHVPDDFNPEIVEAEETEKPAATANEAAPEPAAIQKRGRKKKGK